MRGYKRMAALLLLLVVCLAGLTEVAEAAKKKKKSKSKAAKAGGVDPIRCGVCMVAVDEIFKELATTENSTSTLDLRWGLTATVTEGRAKRIGKVIKYNRSELRAIEVMEKICSEMKKYERYTAVPGEFQLKTREQLKELQETKNTKSEDEKDERKRDQNKFERFCEELTENYEGAITKAIKDEVEYSAFVDAVCFGGPANSCGASRSKCQAGSFSEHEGLVPCSLCEPGFYQAEEGADKCIACQDGFNTTRRGSKAEDYCLKMCAPGHFSGNGLETEGAECTQCGPGAYQPQRGMSKCESCPDGKNTHASGAVFANECVSICGDGRRSSEEGCDDGNKYPGDGCDHDCKIEAGAVCSSLSMGSQSVCNKVSCGDGKTQTAADESVREACDDGNTDAADGCSSECQVETGWKCVQKEAGGRSICNQVTCGDGKKETSDDGSRTEACDDGNTEDRDGCSSKCELEEGFICSARKDAKSSCTKPVCGDSYREAAPGMKEECDDANTEDGDGCSSSCTIEAGFTCEPFPGAQKRKDATGVGEWTSAGKDNCTAIPGYESTDKGKKEGGFFSSMFGGGKKKEEV